MLTKAGFILGMHDIGLLPKSDMPIFFTSFGWFRYISFRLETTPILSCAENYKQNIFNFG